MSIASETLALFRDRWATRLVDAVVVKEETGEVFDPGTGLITPTFTEVYDGPALIRPAGAGEAEFGETTVATVDYLVFIPYSEVDVEPGMLVDVASTHDGQLDGTTLIVNSVNKDTYLTNRRLDCTEYQDAG